MGNSFTTSSGRTKETRLLIAIRECEASAPWVSCARRSGYDVTAFKSIAAMFPSSKHRPVGLVVVSDSDGRTDAAFEAARSIRSIGNTPVLLLIQHGCENYAIAALRLRVNDYLTPPFESEKVLHCIRSLLPLDDVQETGHNLRMVGQSHAIRELTSYASRLAGTTSTVLITGETGTGKDLVAELIHSISARSHRPFIALNCAAIPDTLLESELFGRERGAYTGADTAYEGKLKMADGGSVLFDEIGDLTPYAQAKLLRVLESRHIQRLGSPKEIALNIRVLAATNRDLLAMVEKGEFRRDLYFRLSVTRMELPPLRARSSDVPELLHHFADGFSRTAGVRFPGFTDAALQVLCRYPWPGNVRELRNVVEELFVRLTNRPLDVGDLSRNLVECRCAADREPADERTRIISALTLTHWNKKRAAEELSFSRMTLYRKMAFYQVAAKPPAALPRETAAFRKRAGG